MVAVIVVIFAFTGGLKCCKVTAAHRRERIERQTRRSRNSTPDSVGMAGINPESLQNHLEMYLGRHPPPPSLSNLEDRVSFSNFLARTEAANAALDRYIATAQANNRQQICDIQSRGYRSISPPPYHTVQYKPRPYDPSEPPPLYSTVCNMPSLLSPAPIPVTETRSATIFADVHGTLSAENTPAGNDPQQIRVTFSGEVMTNRDLLVSTRSRSVILREQVQSPTDGAVKDQGGNDGGDVV